MLSKRQSSNLKKKKLPLSKKTVKKQLANALLANIVIVKKPLLQRFFCALILFDLELFGYFQRQSVGYRS